jgi:hypothetical protein
MTTKSDAHPPYEDYDPRWDREVDTEAGCYIGFRGGAGPDLPFCFRYHDSDYHFLFFVDIVRDGQEYVWSLKAFALEKSAISMFGNPRIKSADLTQIVGNIETYFRKYDLTGAPLKAHERPSAVRADWFSWHKPDLV